jgi:hypothetical protein
MNYRLEDAKTRFRDVIDQMLSIDISTSPNYRTTVMMRDALVRHGIMNSVAEQIVTRMKISVSADMMTQDEAYVTEMVDKFAKMTAKVYVQVSKDFVTTDAFVTMATQASFELDF